MHGPATPRQEAARLGGGDLKGLWLHGPATLGLQKLRQGEVDLEGWLHGPAAPEQETARLGEVDLQGLWLPGPATLGLETARPEETDLKDVREHGPATLRKKTNPWVSPESNVGLQLETPLNHKRLGLGNRPLVEGSKAAGRPNMPPAGAATTGQQELGPATLRHETNLWVSLESGVDEASRWLPCRSRTQQPWPWGPQLSRLAWSESSLFLARSSAS